MINARVKSSAFPSKAMLTRDRGGGGRILNLFFHGVKNVFSEKKDGHAARRRRWEELYSACFLKNRKRLKQKLQEIRRGGEYACTCKTKTGRLLAGAKGRENSTTQGQLFGVALPAVFFDDRFSDLVPQPASCASQPRSPERRSL